MPDSITAHVGSYGNVKGFITENVAEFRGIPFATIPARFRRSVRIKSLPESTFDATKHGPYAPQHDTNIDAVIALFGEYAKTLWEGQEGRTMSEENCLNLNIVTPKEAIRKQKLPVLVWIHGSLP
jgi:carboxylesterase type B